MLIETLRHLALHAEAELIHDGFTASATGLEHGRRLRGGLPHAEGAEQNAVRNVPRGGIAHLGPHERSRHLRRRLLAVLLCDATAVGALGVVAYGTRARPSGPTFSAIAGTAAASLAPGVIAVAREARAHRSGEIGGHRMTASVLLFGAGLVINTVGTVAVLAGQQDKRTPRGIEAAVDIALLIGGDAIGAPYLSLVRALHR